LRDDVDFWFGPASLDCIMGTAEGETEAVARAWLARAGKRWRPFLTVAAFQALRKDTEKPLPEDLKKIAVAVECFHKASLIHDDIEDNDALRYGEKTLHEEYGVAVALNVGDLLIGEGYRMLAAADFSAEQKAAMLQVAANGQRQLCRGQGAELCWARTPQPLTQHQVLEIFRKKTAPAFEVALRFGALCAGVEEHAEVEGVLKVYSDALGIAYQIRDDLSDLGASGDTNDIAGLRPSVLLAVAHEKAKDGQKELLASVWRRQLPAGVTTANIESIYGELHADERARVLLETYKEEAIRCLRDLENPNLKGLLRRVVGKIFNDVEIKGWCKEHQENAKG
jgi:geranylgeranyl pyrophosphate synthase